MNSGESFQLGDFRKSPWSWGLGQEGEVQKSAGVRLCLRPPGPFRTAEIGGSFQSSRQGALHLAFSSPGRSPAALGKENQGAPPAASKNVPGVECGTQ